MSNKPWAELNTTDPEIADVLIKVVPWDNSASAGKGACEAPDRIRQLSKVLPPYTENGTELKNFFIADLGDCEVDLNWTRYWQTIKTEIYAMLETKKFCLILGGDHSISIPTEEAFLDTFRHEKVGIIHFDSHSDILDEYCGHRWSHACTQRRALEHPALNDEDLSLIGIRSWEKEELEFLESHPEINIVTAEQIWESGIKKTINSLSSKYKGYNAVYISIDIDVLDPAFAPGTGTPESGGLTSRELIYAIKTLVELLPVIVLDIVEVSPPLDSSDITTWAALKLIYEVFGQVFLKK